jgi:hypothetical protein
VTARRRSRERRRDAAAYDSVIDQFDVESNPRYRKNRDGRGETYCNIFVWDVTRAMTAEIPHWVNEGGDPAEVGCGRETTANTIVAWLQTHGTRFGWRPLDPAGAQQLANRGCPVVAAWCNDGGIGHVAVVRPGTLTDEGPLVAQAGERNVRAERVARAFPEAWRNGYVRFFGHD